MVEFSIDIDQELRWTLSVHGKKLEVLPDSIKSLPPLFSSLSMLREMVAYLDNMVLCRGNPDNKFSSLASSKNGIFHGVSGRSKLLSSVRLLIV